MEFKNEPYKVYIKIDEYNRIKEVNSSAFISDTTDWIEIDKGYGDRYHHAQGNYFRKPLINMDGTHNYIYENGTVRETIEVEKTDELASFPKPKPSDAERIAELESKNEIISEVLDTILMEVL